MGVGAFIEPLVVLTLLFGGTWINRNRASVKIFGARRRSSVSSLSARTPSPYGSSSNGSPRHSESLLDPPSASDGLLIKSARELYYSSSAESGSSSSSSSSSVSVSSLSSSLSLSGSSTWHRRELRCFGLRKEVWSPDNRRFRDRMLSRVLSKFPFLVEVWYWALIYWVYQLGRAFTALTLTSSTVDVARTHALQIIHLEQRLHLFLELPIQHYFLQHPLLMRWTNRIYSFIHIPGTILFLVWLYHHTSIRHSNTLPISNKTSPTRTLEAHPSESKGGPPLYAARRRTMATCNLVAFVIFTLWPCMPPRLLSDPSVPGAIGHEARRYGFVDTVHGAAGESSVWTQNRFCNQYAAMPSLHFGYSLLIGLTIMGMPLAAPVVTHPRTHSQRRSALAIPMSPSRSLRVRVPTAKRLVYVALGLAYPVVILAAIVATANHFVLDAVAGATVCGVAWKGNAVLLNLLPVEDYFLWCLGICKPGRGEVEVGGCEDSK